MWPFLTSLTSFSLSARKGSGAHFLSEGICLHLTFTSYVMIQTNGSTADPILVQTNPPNTLFRLIRHDVAHCPQQASHQSGASPQNLIQNQVTQSKRWTYNAQMVLEYAHMASSIQSVKHARGWALHSTSTRKMILYQQHSSITKDQGKNCGRLSIISEVAFQMSMTKFSITFTAPAYSLFHWGK